MKVGSPKVTGTGNMLPDVLTPGLKLVFVGTAAGRRSAQDGAYYAHPGNRFWRALHEVGLTPRLFRPEEFGALPALGIGFTDLCKTQSGNDSAITAFDVPRFEAEMRRFRPRLIAFTSKKGASLWSGRATRDIVYGEQPAREGFPPVFVLPSPSGAASGHWDIAPWRALAQRIGV